MKTQKPADIVDGLVELKKIAHTLFEDTAVCRNSKDEMKQLQDLLDLYLQDIDTNRVNTNFKENEKEIVLNFARLKREEAYEQWFEFGQHLSEIV